MIVFKTFWKVLKKYQGTIILYTVMLIVFGGINFQNKDVNDTFVASKPDILIINEGTKTPLKNNLIHYFEKNANLKNVKDDQVDDALFYRDVNYIIYLPSNYDELVLKGELQSLKVKSTNDYLANIAKMLLTRYLKVQNFYGVEEKNTNLLCSKINASLNNSTKVNLMTKVDLTKTQKATTYFNFASYSIMAVVIFVISLVLSSFHEKKVLKRTLVSSYNYKKFNKDILFASFIYTFLASILFVILGIILLPDIIFSVRGIFYILNIFIFAFVSLTIALLISNLIHNKEAISGIINVLALGSAFLCGAFVPAQYLPPFVLKLAHVLPSYYFVNSNDLLKSVEVFNFESLKPIIFNMLILLVFAVILIIINNEVSKIKQKKGLAQN